MFGIIGIVLVLLFVILHLAGNGLVCHTTYRTRGATAMIMTSRLRKFVLTVHLTFSVGLIGAVFAYLTLVVAAMASQDVQTVRAAWIAMELIG